VCVVGLVRAGMNILILIKSVHFDFCS
jgi:hypothetical protein